MDKNPLCTPPDVTADDLRFLAASLRGWTMDVLGDIERRYNPHQPRRRCRRRFSGRQAGSGDLE